MKNAERESTKVKWNLSSRYAKKYYLFIYIFFKYLFVKFDCDLAKNEHNLVFVLEFIFQKKRNLPSSKSNLLILDFQKFYIREAIWNFHVTILSFTILGLFLINRM